MRSVVRVYPGPPFFLVGGTHDGAIAQLGERLLCKQDVVGSIPSGSTTSIRPEGQIAPVERFEVRRP